MADTHKPVRTGVIELKPLEVGVRLEARTERVTFPFSFTLREISIASPAFESVVDAIGYARGQGLTEMASRTLPGREGGVFPLMEQGSRVVSDYVISSVRSIQSQLPSNGYRVYWVIERLGEVDKQYLSRPIMD